MDNLNLFFTSIEQVIGTDNINESDFNSRNKSNFPEDWGEDRIVILKDKDTPVKRQWNGTCTSFATIAAMENKLGGKVELSERSLWDYYGKFSTGMAIKAANNNFILEEKYWPQGQSRINDEVEKLGRYRVAKFSNLKTNYLSVVQAIDKGNPCVVGLSTPKDLAKGHKQVEASSKVSKKGGHAMCVSGYKVENGKCYFLVKNSWGTRFGDNGYQYIAFELYRSKRKRYCYFWEIEELEKTTPETKFAGKDDSFESYWEFE
jgi:hypothetical protein